MQLTNEHRCSCGHPLPYTTGQVWEGLDVCDRCHRANVAALDVMQREQMAEWERQSGVHMLFVAGCCVLVACVVLTACVGAWI